MKLGIAAIGVDLGGTSVKLGLVSSRGKVLERRSFTTGKSATRRAVLEKLEQSVRDLQERARSRKLKLAGVGIGAPGPIDVERGLVYLFPNLPGWENFPLQKHLHRSLGVRVCIENDANAMALGEYRFGGGRGSRVFLALTLGTGIGGGLVLHGQLFHGPAFSAAEFGHVVIDPSGPRCACGNRGCVEAFVGNGYFVREASRRLRSEASVLRKWMARGEKLTPILVEKAARQGDRLARRLWADAGERLGTMLAGMINVLNPDCIAIGGGLAQSGELILGPTRAAIRKKAFPIAFRSVKVIPAVLGTDAGLVGAASLVFSPARPSSQPF